MSMSSASFGECRMLPYNIVKFESFSSSVRLVIHLSYFSDSFVRSNESVFWVSGLSHLIFIVTVLFFVLLIASNVTRLFSLNLQRLFHSPCLVMFRDLARDVAVWITNGSLRRFINMFSVVLFFVSILLIVINYVVDSV